MNVLFACEYFPPFAPGGAEWSILLQARELVRRGHRVTVVTPNYGAKHHEEMDGIEVQRFTWRHAQPGQASVRALWNQNPVFYLLFAWHLIRVARRIGANVIHAQHANALPGAYLAARLIRRPVFFTVRDTGLICPFGALCLLQHDVIPADCGLIKIERECSEQYLRDYGAQSIARRVRVKLGLPLAWVDVALKKAILRRVDGIVGVSRGILRVYESVGLIATGQGHPVYTQPPEAGTVKAADPGRARARFGLNGRPVVLYVGKQSPGKGTAVFIEAADIVATEHPETIFVLAGKGAIAARPSHAQVHFLGSLPQTELFDLYALADLVVVPSIWPEPLSRVILEAAAFGKPCIGTNVGGTPEAILNGETGLIVPRGDAQALARAILDLLKNDEQRVKMGQRAQEFVAERFNADTAIGLLVSIYEAGIRKWQR
jgi:glycosyltransferase involved in cell wall biosynthesis